MTVDRAAAVEVPPEASTRATDSTAPGTAVIDSRNGAFKLPASCRSCCGGSSSGRCGSGCQCSGSPSLLIISTSIVSVKKASVPTEITYTRRAGTAEGMLAVYGVTMSWSGVTPEIEMKVSKCR